jgi:TetR/AcrR family transcriptional regulator
MSQHMSMKASTIGVETADRILAAAEGLFAELGFDAVSMNAIAARAGVSKANIFHHFSSKNALYIAVLREACRDAAEDLHNLENDNLPFPERLANFAHEHLSHILEREQVTRLIQREIMQNGQQRGQELAEKVFGDKFKRFVDILRDGQQRGELRAGIDPAMVATLLIGANVFFFETRELLRHFPDVGFAADPARYSSMLIDILLRGILPATDGNG